MKVRANGLVTYVAVAPNNPPPQPPQQPLAQMQTQPPTGGGVFSDTDESDFHQLYNGRAYYLSQNFPIDTQLAIPDYLSDVVVPGTLYSVSQNLNHKMKMGLPLTANEQYMVDSLKAGMHNIGYNVTLTRYARVGFMDMLGVKNYQNMTAQQLQAALVGRGYTEKGFISTSYNNFANAPAGNPFTDKAVRINYKAPANTQALMPGNGPGGALGEMVLAPDQHYQITGVRFTGKMGRSGGNMYPGIEIDVKVG